jgi:hypothetical protein
VIVRLSVRRVISKPMNKDFKIKYTKTSKSKYTRISRSSIRGLRSFLFKAMRQVSLNILHLYFSIYSVELELHDRKVCSVHLCQGLIRIDLSFFENHITIWVVIIGLELLSLACPGLGSDIVAKFILVSPYHCYGYLILLVWRIGFGTVFVGF